MPVSLYLFLSLRVSSSKTSVMLSKKKVKKVLVNFLARLREIIIWFPYKELNSSKQTNKQLKQK